MEQTVCPACSRLGLTRLSESVIYEGCPICYDLLTWDETSSSRAAAAADGRAAAGDGRAGATDDTSKVEDNPSPHPCSCLSCKTVRACAAQFGDVNSQLPGFSVKIGLGIPPWLRTEIHYDTILAVREILTSAVRQYFSTKNAKDNPYCCKIVQKRATKYDRLAEERYVLEIICTTQHCSHKAKKRRKSTRKSTLDVTLKDRLVYDIGLEWQSCSILYGGNYVKLCRDLAQTKWINKDYYSIEEYLREFFKEAHKPSGPMNLIGAGREDLDVCMLGEGRPFLFEIKNPLHYDDIEIPNPLYFHDQKIIIRNLQKLDLKSFANVSSAIRSFNDASETKLKVYGLVVTTSEEIQNLEEINQKYSQDDVGRPQAQPKLQINQATPSRVAHRRANITRPKNIYSLRIQKIQPPSVQGKAEVGGGIKAEAIEAASGDVQSTGDAPGEAGAEVKAIKTLEEEEVAKATHAAVDQGPLVYVCQIIASGGFYIKEFIHGDFGRTKPSFSDLVKVNSADLIQLDVLNLINMT